MLPPRARVDRIPREHRIHASIEDDVTADLRELIGDTLEGGALPAAGPGEPQRARDFPFSMHEHAGPVVVLLERQIGAARDRAARRQATERSPLHALLEVDGGPFGAAPGQGKCDAAAFAHPLRIRQRQTCAVDDAMPVLPAQDRVDEHVRKASADDARRLIGIAGHDDLHRPFVDDDHEHDLRRVGNRREALEDLHALEPLCRPQPGGDRFDRRVVDRHADADVRETAHLLVRRRGVALNLDPGHEGLLRQGPAKAGRHGDHDPAEAGHYRDRDRDRDGGAASLRASH